MTEPEDDLALRAITEHGGPGERAIEAPSVDAYEQTLTTDPADRPLQVSRSLEVDEWDAVEQATVVDLDDDYR